MHGAKLPTNQKDNYLMLYSWVVEYHWMYPTNVKGAIKWFFQQHLNIVVLSNNSNSFLLVLNRLQLPFDRDIRYAIIGFIASGIHSLSFSPSPSPPPSLLLFLPLPIFCTPSSQFSPITPLLSSPPLPSPPPPSPPLPSPPPLLFYSPLSQPLS